MGGIFLFEDVLQRLRAVFGGLQTAHLGMAGLSDGLRSGQGRDWDIGILGLALGMVTTG